MRARAGQTVLPTERVCAEAFLRFVLELAMSYVNNYSVDIPWQASGRRRAGRGLECKEEKRVRENEERGEEEGGGRARSGRGGCGG